MSGNVDSQIPVHGDKFVIDLVTGKVFEAASDELDAFCNDGGKHSFMALLKAEPYFAQYSGSAASPRERTDDGKYDRSHLSPEKAYRLGRDYLAHCLRYGWPMNVIREHVGPGGRILEMGCGKELPMFRALTCDHSAVMHYKPVLYVGADLNDIHYRPEITGCKSVILPRTNIIDNPSAMPDEPFDIIVSFEVLEHMDKPDGERFLDAMVEYAKRKPAREGKPCIILLSTPVNGGNIAKNHIYEWRRSELRRAWEKRGAVVKREFGTFSNINELMHVLTKTERAVWNSMVEYHSPHTLSCFFSAMHPEAARNIAWHVEVA